MRRERFFEAPVDDARGLVQLARRQLLRQACGEADEAKRERLIQAQRRALDQRRRNFWAASLVAAAALALTLQRAFSVAEPLLAYTASPCAVVGRAGEVLAERYIFSDGTSISLSRDAALSVVSAERESPRVRLDRGDAEIQVIHRAHAHWKFVAGPFEVEVVGTAFDLHWSPTARDFSLNLREGVVEISGPILDGPLLLRAGHKVLVSVDTGRVAITSAPELNGSASAQSAAPALQATPAPQSTQMPMAMRTSFPAAAVTATPSFVSWRTLVGRGRFEDVIREAQALPVDTCLARCAAADLRALGDAARYSGRASLAERAFLSLRQRFPGTSDGTVAAFLLGRTFETQRQPAQAGAWYNRYLAEAPSGPFAVEAESGRARVVETR
jgi:ferric-dicitrate binding protein FerR (iron transport regulator)